MIEFVLGLTTLQWVLVGVGIYLLFPMAKDFLINIRNTVPVDVPDKTVEVTTDHDLTSIVHKWEVLYSACVEAGLEDARKKLREVFPMFANLPLHINPPNKVLENTNE